MNKEWMFRDNDEWMKQKAKIEVLKAKIDAIENKLKSGAYWSDKDKLRIICVKNGYWSAISYAYKRLERIEDEIISKYNIDALAFDSFDDLGDEFYIRKIKQNGFIDGFKF